MKIPVIANGNIRTLNDAMKCIELTGCDAVMSGEGLLHNPALFDGDDYTLTAKDSGKRGVLEQDPKKALELAYEYKDMCIIHPPGTKAIRAHLFRLFITVLPSHVDLRDQLSEASGEDNIWNVLDLLKHRIENNLSGPDPATYKPRNTSIPPPKVDGDGDGDATPR